MKPGAFILGAAGPVALLAVALAAFVTTVSLGERNHGGPADIVRQAQAYPTERHMQLESAPFAAIDARHAGTPHTARFAEIPAGTLALASTRPNRIVGAVDAYTGAIAAFIKTLAGESEELSR